MTDDLKARLRSLSDDLWWRPLAQQAADRIAALEAALADMTQQRDAAMAGAVKVKPIVFNKRGIEWWGSSAFGIYVIAEVDTDTGRMWAFWRPDANEDDVDASSGFFSDERDAMAAAQADCEASILSALTPDPDRMLALTAAAGLLGGGDRVQHVKRGSEYTVIGTAKVQTDTPLADYAEVKIYRGDDGLIWVRPVSEFEDGRFEVMP